MIGLGVCTSHQSTAVHLMLDTGTETGLLLASQHAGYATDAKDQAT